MFQLEAQEKGVLGAGEAIAKVIPQDGVKAEVWVSNRDIGFVKEGQSTEVRIEAFDYAEFGTVKGKVSAIGADVMKPDEENNSYRFPVTIQLDRDHLKARNLEIPLRAGLAITTNLHLRERKLISIISDMFGTQFDSLNSLR